MMTLDDIKVNEIAAEDDSVQYERSRIVHKQSSLNTAYTTLRALDQSRALDPDTYNPRDLTTTEDDLEPFDVDRHDDEGHSEELQCVIEDVSGLATTDSQHATAEPELEPSALPTLERATSEGWQAAFRAEDHVSATGPTKLSKKAKKKSKAVEDG